VAEVPGLDAVLSAEGWPYASSDPVAADDPGRFRALFGRDSLIIGLQLLPVRRDVAVATLRALARRQGRRVDPATQEEPGKIGHEFRDSPPAALIAEGWPSGGEFRYFATADATSWFLVLLDAVRDDALVAELEVAWRGAASWLRGQLDRGGGLLRHAPGSQRGGLTQQGWRDTTIPTSAHGGGTLRPDGSIPRPPLADADTQAVTVAAVRALTRLAPQEDWAERLSALRRLITDSYLPDIVLLDADGSIAGPGSQLGWLLWADAIEPQAVDAAAERLCRPDIATPYGLRTLASTAPGFDPMAYHRGSVWPFDSWLGWGGLRAAGRLREAEGVRAGVLQAVEQLGGYPELYAVTRDGALTAVPIANRVQGWTVGAAWALRHQWDGRMGSSGARP
jgi:glycogen debranching enzyme